MNGDLNQKIIEYASANMPGSIITPQGAVWLYTTFKKTKTQQKNDFVAWLNARKAANLAAINAEPAISSAKVAAIEADNDIIDTVVLNF